MSEFRGYVPQEELKSNRDFPVNEEQKQQELDEISKMNLDSFYSDAKRLNALLTKLSGTQSEKIIAETLSQIKTFPENRRVFDATKPLEALKSKLLARAEKIDTSKSQAASDEYLNIKSIATCIDNWTTNHSTKLLGKKIDWDKIF